MEMSMNSNISVVVIYGLIIIFAVLSIVFLKGKGKTLFVGHNTTKEPRFSTTKLSKVVGMCFSIITVILFITALIWNVCPEWYQYFFWVIIGGNIVTITIVCHLNIIFRN